MTSRPSTTSNVVSCWSSGPVPAMRLICIPYAGGGVSMFYNWINGLPAPVQVCALQLPGRDTQIRVAPATRAIPLAERLAATIEPLLDLPYALFGHSMGGLLAFELARELRRRGLRTPLHFFVSACRAAQKAGRQSPMHRLPEDQFIWELRQRYNGLPDAIFSEPDLLQMFLPILRADLELVETYQDPGGEPFDFPVSAFGGVRDTEILPEDLEGWRQQTTRAFRLEMFPGDHFFINSERPALLRAIHRDLAAYL